MYEHIGMYPEAAAAFKQAIACAENLFESGTFWLVNPRFGSSLPLEHLAHIYLIEQNMKNVVYYQSKLLQSDPHNLTVLSQMLEFMTSKESVEAMQRFIDRMYISPSARDLLVLVTILSSIGQLELSQHYLNKLNHFNILSLDTRLRLSILQQNQDQFLQTVVQGDRAIDQASSLRLIFIAGLMWGEHFHKNCVQQLQFDSFLDERLAFYNEVLHSASIDLNNTTSSLLFELCSLSIEAIGTA
jgi:tetratricopeptide (TPR) repeat protein